ncbi:MAG: LysR family transcriptional regulator [Acidobacteriota bacterium]|nr:LysR family transcriptional regulator [Acidobacteriota bacterium]
MAQAARRLEISQPAAFYQARSLEHAVGADLFSRSAQGVDLTPAGSALLPYAQKLVDVWDDEVWDDAQRAVELSKRGPGGGGRPSSDPGGAGMREPRRPQPGGDAGSAKLTAQEGNC